MKADKWKAFTPNSVRRRMRRRMRRRRASG